MKTNVLKGKIVAAGYSQRSLARELDMSANSLCSKVNGKAEFTCDEAIAICDILSITDNAEKADIFLS